jgi:hypothetical protein
MTKPLAMTKTSEKLNPYLIDRSGTALHVGCGPMIQASAGEAQ